MHAERFDPEEIFILQELLVDSDDTFAANSDTLTQCGNSQADDVLDYLIARVMETSTASDTILSHKEAVAQPVNSLDDSASNAAPVSIYDGMDHAERRRIMERVRRTRLRKKNEKRLLRHEITRLSERVSDLQRQKAQRTRCSKSDSSQSEQSALKRAREVNIALRRNIQKNSEHADHLMWMLRTRSQMRAS